MAQTYIQVEPCAINRVFLFHRLIQFSRPLRKKKETPIKWSHCILSLEEMLLDLPGRYNQGLILVCQCLINLSKKRAKFKTNRFCRLTVDQEKVEDRAKTVSIFFTKKTFKNMNKNTAQILSKIRFFLSYFFDFRTLLAFLCSLNEILSRPNLSFWQSRTQF